MADEVPPPLDDRIAHALVRSRAAARLFGDPPEPVRVGRYDVLRWLGAGGAGVVYLAWDPQLHREVALKLLRSDDTEAVLREARAMARITHPHAVQVHDVGVFEGSVFLAMERVDGPTLRSWSAGRDPRDVLECWLQVIEAIAHAHDQGLVHCDVKPDNVLVGADGRARIVDFGLVRAVGSSQGDVGGTPAYMAPEQARGEPAVPASDQFAVCRSVVEAWGGEVALVPARYRSALVRGLAPRPEDRHSHIRALGARLRRDPRTERWRVAVHGLLAVFAVVAMVGTVLQVWMFLQMWGRI